MSNIPKGLKVGDVFEDSGRYFEVQSIVPVGYISKQVEKPVEVVQKETEKTSARGRKKKA